MAPGLKAGKGAAAGVCSGVGPELLSLEDLSLGPGIPSQEVEDRPSMEVLDPVAKSTALIQIDLAFRLGTHEPRDLGKVIYVYKRSEPQFPHVPKEDDGSFVKSGLNKTMHVGVPSI